MAEQGHPTAVVKHAMASAYAIAAQPNQFHRPRHTRILYDRLKPAVHGDCKLWPAQISSCSCQASNDAAARDTTSQLDLGGGSSSSSATRPEAWSLMGRVVRSDRLVLGAGGQQRLKLLAAAREAGITPEEMQQRVQVCRYHYHILHPTYLANHASSCCASACSNANSNVGV